MAEVRSHSPDTTRGAPRFPDGATPQRPRPAALSVKHAIDRIVGAAALLVTAPLMAAVAIALYYGGGGRILHREERLGEHGRKIAVRSFAITDELCRRSRGWRLVAAGGLAMLPQLWSVLRGEMSIIGPRPRDLGQPPPPMRPGLTGPAQLEQLERWVSISEQLQLDAEYARGWSFRLDARIVWRTMWCVLR